MLPCRFKVTRFIPRTWPFFRGANQEPSFCFCFRRRQTRHFNEEDSPALTRCTSLSSLHIDGEVIGTAKLSPLVGTGRRPPAPHRDPGGGDAGGDDAGASAALPRSGGGGGAATAAAADISVPLESAELSEESEGSDDGLLEDIITMGRPLCRPPAHPPKQQVSVLPSFLLIYLLFRS